MTTPRGARRGLDGHRRPARARLWPLIAAALAAGAPVGCSGLTLGGAGTARLTLESSAGDTSLSPAFQTAVFRAEDHNSVHIYLTDVPALASDTPPANPTGNLLHIHMFLYPQAGKTPIDFTASNCTITHVVLAEGAIGVYRGGGFLLPSGRPSRSFGGRLADATLRPASATPAFRDLLGWSELTGRVNARRDAEQADRLAAVLRTITRRPSLEPVELAAPDEPTYGEGEDEDAGAEGSGDGG